MDYLARNQAADQIRKDKEPRDENWGNGRFLESLRTFVRDSTMVDVGSDWFAADQNRPVTLSFFALSLTTSDLIEQLMTVCLACPILRELATSWVWPSPGL